MKLGAYTAVLHDEPLSEAVSILRGMGLDEGLRYAADTLLLASARSESSMTRGGR
jgi:hypothetical protein